MLFRSDFSAARAKALAFRLAAIQDAQSEEREGSQILADAGRKGLVQIVPWREGRQTYSSPGNRFLVHPADAATLREQVLTGDLSAELCEKHVIPPESLDALRERNYVFFVVSRYNRIIQLERDFALPLARLFDPNDLFSPSF